MTSQRDRAPKLIEKEDQQAARRQEQRDQEAHESRIKSAIQRVKEQDRRAERERQRADALDRAENMEPEIIQKHREADDAMEAFVSAVNELESLHEQYRALLRTAEAPVPALLREELRWWLYSHLGDRAELSRELSARRSLRGEPGPISLASDGQ